MRYAQTMIGNSSSGIVEAPSFSLPVVNIGNRQKGKIFSKNIIQCGHNKNEIVKAINKGISLKFKKQIKKINNPYGDARSGPRIAKILSNIKINEKLLKKKFIDS